MAHVATWCLVLALATPALAQSSAVWKRDASGKALIEGNRPIAAWSRAAQRCLEYPRYTVLEQTGASLDALSISVLPATVRCRQVDQQGVLNPVFQVRNPAEFFAGLVGDVLITDRGSGPDGRVLTLYNMVSRSKLRQLSDVDGPFQLRQTTKLILWQISARATPSNCSAFEKHRSMNLGSAIQRQIVVDLMSNKLQRTNHVRCIPQQAPSR